MNEAAYARKCQAARTTFRVMLSVAALLSTVLLLGAYVPPGLGDETSDPAHALVSGIYAGPDSGSCCWLSDLAIWKIRPPKDAVSAVITIFVPDYRPFRTALESLAVRVGYGPVTRACCYGPGIHQFPVAVPPHAGGAVFIVRAKPSISFVPKAIGLNNDPRRLSVLLRGIEFRSADGAVLARTADTEPWSRIGSGLYVLLAFVVFWVFRKRPIWGLAALVVIEPLGKEYPIWHTTISPFKTSLVAALAGLAFHPAWRSLLRDRRALVLFGSILCIAGASALSITNASYHEPVLRETLKAMEYALSFAIAYVALRADPVPSVMRNAFAVSTVLVCVAALAQELGGSPEAIFVGGHVIPRIAGALEGPNQLAGWLGIVAPVSFAFFAQLRTTGVLAVLTELLTLSRGGTVGMIGAVIAIFSRSINARVIAGAAVLGFGIMALRFGFDGRVRGIDRYNGGLGTRSDLWHAAFAMFRAHPITGVGAGNYELLLGQYGMLGVRTHANSWYLQGMAEGGILMLVAISFVVTATIIVFARCRSGFGLAAFAATIGICLHQIVDDLVYYPKVGAMWWLLLGVAAALLSLPDVDGFASSRASTRQL